MVSDIITSQKDIYEGCRAVVAAAYDMWLRYETRTDDISIVIVELISDVVKSPFRADSIDAIAERSRSTSYASRPIRRGASFRQRRKIKLLTVDNSSDSALNNDVILEAPVIAKSDEEIDRIRACIRHNFMHLHLNSAQESVIINAMERRIVSAGDVLIRQGDNGDSFYVINSGQYEVHVLTPSSTDQQLGDLVHFYDRSGSFGELSLM